MKLSFLFLLLLSISYPQVDTIEVFSGWNLIGSVVNGSVTDFIQTYPPDIISSPFFCYNPPYSPSDTLKRGRGYWVKVNQDGKLFQGIHNNFLCGITQLNYAGTLYNTILINNKCWMKENLNVGTMIPGTQDQANNGVVEKYCYNDDSTYCSIYGGLYMWYEANQFQYYGAQGICPSGWHIPSYIEYQELAAYVNADGNALKSIGQGTGNGAGTNTSGFSALLAGRRNTGAAFELLGINGHFWTSTPNTPVAWILTLTYTTSEILAFTKLGRTLVSV